MELKNLDKIYKGKIEEELSAPGVSEKDKIRIKSEFIESLKESDGLIKNMNKYLCFSVENRRFFNVSF